MLSLKGIHKVYKLGEQKVHALKGLDIDFRKCEFVSVLGPSGCGKTTLMNIIGGLDKYSKGDLMINGMSTKKYKSSDWDNYRNKKIGFIFQNYNLISHLNVYMNVEIALTISGITKEERKKRTLKALEEVGLLEQKNQKPNQLSGGQMQRVAIARALVNDPEILLADEPTGALDTTTSTQIMELIKKIALDRLVIMVTHNPDLANIYSTRLIKMVDGLIISDSNPYNVLQDLEYIQKIEQEKAIEVIKSKQKKKKEKSSSMSYKTALTLSGRNLIKKRGRTLLTSIAGSIGIIGICLILALTGGVNNFIDDMQKDTLASNPLTLTEHSLDYNQVNMAFNNRQVFEDFPKAQQIFVLKALSMVDLSVKNDLNEELITYLNNSLDPSLYNDITYKTGLRINVYGKRVNQDSYSLLTNQKSSSGSVQTSSSNIWQLLLEEEFIKSQYDLLDGYYPTSLNEIVIIVNKNNTISEETLIDLGLKEVNDEQTEIAFSDVLNKTFKIGLNDSMYLKVGSNFILKSPADIDFDELITVKVTGILRVKEETTGGVLSNGVGYTKQLYQEIQNSNLNSEIVKFMNNNSLINPFTGEEYVDELQTSKEDIRLSDMRSLGGVSKPNEISIYPKTFEAKEEIKKVLDDYNLTKKEGEKLVYIDLSELIGEALNSIVNVISGVLIGFTAISLVVSSIMIAIITYVSVLERTKEIGILRSIGARKKDITRVFNAETILIGFIAGLIGVIVAYLLSIPINIIVKSAVDVSNIASLSILYALGMIIISIVITVLSGLIPANKAANQDPVVALRTE